jgi:hypothetical protein
MLCNSDQEKGGIKSMYDAIHANKKLKIIDFWWEIRQNEIQSAAHSVSRFSENAKQPTQCRA